MENLVKLKPDRLEEISLPSPVWRKKRSFPLSLNWFFEEEVGAKERKGLYGHAHGGTSFR